VRAEHVLSVAACLALGACLASPPPAEGGAPGTDAGGADGGAAAGDADGAPADDGGPDAACPSGGCLDFAYVSRIALEGDGVGSHISLADIGVFVNPGSADLEVAYLSAHVRVPGGIAASIELRARDDQLALPASEAHGALGTAYTGMVLTEVPEAWTDQAYPSLAADLDILTAITDDTEVVLDLGLGGYHFEAPVTLVPQTAAFEGEPLGSDRIRARCGD